MDRYESNSNQAISSEWTVGQLVIVKSLPCAGLDSGLAQCALNITPRRSMVSMGPRLFSTSASFAAAAAAGHSVALRPAPEGRRGPLAAAGPAKGRGAVASGGRRRSVGAAARFRGRVRAHWPRLTASLVRDP